MKIFPVIGNRIVSMAARQAWRLLFGIVSLALCAGTASAAIAVDKTVSKDQGTSSKTVATAAFSTTSANELLLAFISTDGASSGNTTVSSISGGGLAWVLVRRTNTQLGTSEIWRAFSPAVLTGVTVTATLSVSTASSMTVMTFTGTDTTGTSGAGAIGATGTGNSAKGAPAASLVTTRNNSLVIGVGNDWDNAISRTPGTGQTVVHQYLAPAGDTYWVQRQNSTTPASGTSVAINDTAPSTDRYNLTIAEILAPATTVPTITATAGTSQSTTVTATFATALQATAKDSSGNPVSGASVTFTAPATTGPSGTFGGSATATVSTGTNGVATAPAFTADTLAGSYTVTATTSGATSPASFSLTNIAGPPMSVAATAGTPQSATIKTTFTTALQATVRDANNNPVSGASVIFVAPATGASGTFSNGTATITVATAATGVASSTFTANAVAGGPYSVTATVSGLTPLSFNLTNNPGPAASIVATAGASQSTMIGSAFTTALQAMVTDGSSNPIVGASVIFTAPATGASGTFSNGTATISVATDSNGMAIEAFTANTVAGGPYTVTAKTGTLTAANFSLTNNPGPASSIAATAGGSQSATVNTAFTTALQAKVTDASNNPLSGVQVTFTAPGSGASGTFSNGTATIVVATASTGVASAPFTANGTPGGPYLVTASAAGVTPTVSFSMTNNSAPPANIAATAGNSQSAMIGSAFTTSLQATVTDGSSNPIVGASVIFTAPATGASGTFSNGTATITVLTVTGGVATAAFTANTVAGGPYTVTAKTGTLTAANFSLTNNPGPASSIAATAGGSQSATVNTAFTTALQAKVTDASNNPLSGVQVTFTAPGSGTSGTFSNGTATIVVATASTGVASAPFTANGTPGGPYLVTASAAGVAGSVSFSLTNNSAPPANIAATAGNSQSTMIGSAFTISLQATVTDAGNNPVVGASVTFTAPATGASGTFSNGTATISVATDSNGMATEAFTANTVAGGPYTVTAKTGTLTANFSLTNNPGPASSIAATAGGSQSATVNTAFTTALQAKVTDASNNPLSGVQVTFTAPGSGASGTFSNGTATIVVATASTGVASAPFTANGTPGGPYLVTASAAGVTPTVSFSLTNNALPPANIAATGGNSQSTMIGSGFTTSLQATVTDAGNNPVVGASVTFTAPATGASGTFSNGTATISVATDSNGMATEAFTANTVAGGPYTVTAKTGTLTANFSLTNNPGPASNIAATAGGSQSATVNTAFTTALQAKVTDASNNPLSGVQVTFTAPGSGASGTFSNGTATITIATASTGVASAPFTANATAGGPYTVTAVAAGVTPTASFSLTNNASAPAALAIDVTTSTDAATAKTTVVTPSFSTKSASELLLAFVSTDQISSPNTTVTGVTGGGLTWVMVYRTNVQNGDAEIWRAFAPSTLSGVTVTAMLSQSVVSSITVVSFTGADATGTNGSGAIGATGSGNSAKGAPTASLVTTRNGSWVFGVGNDYDKGTARTLGTGQTLIHQDLATVGDTYWVQRQTNTTPTGGTTVTINDTAPTGDDFNLSIVEVLPSTGQVPVPDLTVTKSHSGNFVQGQTGATYTVTVTNSGAAATSGTVTLTDALPASLTATAISGTNWNCTLSTLTCTRSDALAPASSYPAITLTVNVSASAPGSVTNTATVSGGGEANTSNDSASDVTTIIGPPDLTIAKSHAGSFAQGQTAATYTIVVTNSGGSSTSGAVTVTDIIPADLTPTAMNGTGWACTLTTLTCTRSDALTAGASYQSIALTASVAGNAPNSVTNTATVSGGGETNTSNDTANDLTSIVTATSVSATMGTPQSATVNTSFATNMQATVMDAGNNLLSGIPVTFSAPGSGASGTFTNGTATIIATTDNGVATASFTANGVAGGYTVTASVAGVNSPATFSLTNNPNVLGDSNVESIPLTVTQGQVEVVQAPATATGSVNTLSVYLDPTSTSSQIYVGIYADDGNGQPGALLAEGNLGQGGTSAIPSGWNSIAISPSLQVTNVGTPYWIAMLGTQGGNTVYRVASTNATTCSSETSVAANLTDLPAPWTPSTGTPGTTCPASIYASLTLNVSGTVSGIPAGSGPTLVALSGTPSATTTADTNGNYAFSVLPNQSYTVTPSDSGYNFTPASQTVNVNSSSVSNINFVTLYSISGNVAGLSGVTVYLSGPTSASTASDRQGNYSFTGLSSGGPYTVTPSDIAYIFSPLSSQPITISNANVTGIDFTSSIAPPAYSISGQITLSSKGVGGGSTVTLTSAATGAVLLSTTASSTGSFTLAGIPNGSYIVTPSSSTAVFTPASLAITINGASYTKANFTAAGLIFYDNFAGTTLSSQWFNMNEYGDTSNSELECYLPSQVIVNNGLMITTQYVSGGTTCGTSNTPASYVSGKIVWANPIDFTYGKVEYKAEMPGGTGTWPTVWLLGHDCQPVSANQSGVQGGETDAGTCNWPAAGSDEIDMTEILSSIETSVNQEVHSSTSNAGCSAKATNVSKNYHVYDFIWTSSTLTWEIDGVVTCTVPASAISATPKFLIINTAVGGVGGTPKSNTYPQTMTVDYVEVTQP